jgi:hypothetical protein
MPSNSKNIAELLNTDTTVAVGDITDGSVTTAKLAADAVTAAKLADNAVVTANISDSAVTSGKVNPAGLNLGRRNLIINGAMQVWQRGTTSGALGHQSAYYHTADRWGATLDQDQGSGTLTTTYSQSTDVPSTDTFPYSLKAVVASSGVTPSGTDCTALFYQHIETLNANPLGWGTSAAKQATLTYWIKSSVAGTGTLQLRLNDSNQVNGVADGQLYTKFTINQANTWEKKTHLIPANATDGWRRNVSESAIQMYWFFGSNQAAAPTQDAWFRQNNYGQKHSDATFNFQATGGTVYLTGVQFEVGDTATDFEHRSHEEELRLCSRYFRKIGRHMGGAREGYSASTVTFYPGMRLIGSDAANIVTTLSTGGVMYSRAGVNNSTGTLNGTVGITSNSTEQAVTASFSHNGASTGSTYNGTVAGFYVDGLTFSAEL